MQKYTAEQHQLSWVLMCEKYKQYDSWKILKQNLYGSNVHNDTINDNHKDFPNLISFYLIKRIAVIRWFFFFIKSRHLYIFKKCSDIDYSRRVCFFQTKSHTYIHRYKLHKYLAVIVWQIRCNCIKRHNNRLYPLCFL